MAQFNDTKNLIYNYNVLDLDAFTCVHLTDAFTCVHLYNGGGGGGGGGLGGAKVLGKLSVLGRPTSLDDSRARVYCACSRCG